MPAPSQTRAALVAGFEQQRLVEQHDLERLAVRGDERQRRARQPPRCGPRAVAARGGPARKPMKRLALSWPSSQCVTPSSTTAASSAAMPSASSRSRPDSSSPAPHQVTRPAHDRQHPARVHVAHELGPRRACARARAAPPSSSAISRPSRSAIVSAPTQRRVAVAAAASRPARAAASTWSRLALQRRQRVRRRRPPGAAPSIARSISRTSAGSRARDAGLVRLEAVEVRATRTARARARRVARRGTRRAPARSARARTASLPVAAAARLANGASARR